MSEPATNPAAEAAAAATSFPAPTISLPLGLEVLRTSSGALILVEIVSVSDFFFFLSFFLIQFLSRRDLARRCSRRSYVATFAADVSGDARAECSPAGLFPGLQ